MPSYRHTSFAGEVAVTATNAQIRGTLTQLNKSLHAFRQSPYVGYGFSLSLDANAKLGHKTMLFVHGIPLLWYEKLRNIGTEVGIVDSTRHYFDSDSFLNHGALIKGTYGYTDLRLPPAGSFSIGLKQQMGENLLFQLELAETWHPVLKLTLDHNGYTISTAYAYPALYGLELGLGKDNLSVAIYWDKRFTSAGLRLRGSIHF